MKGESGSPCFGCDERHLGCHGDCEEYKAYRDSKVQEAQERAKFIPLYEYGRIRRDRAIIAECRYNRTRKRKRG